MSRHLHEVADRRSLLLHCRVAEHMLRDSTIRDRARARVEQWQDNGEVAMEYVKRWSHVLDRPIAEIAAFLSSNEEEAASLRQVSPFAGALRARERWELLRAEKAEREHEAP